MWPRISNQFGANENHGAYRMNIPVLNNSFGRIGVALVLVGVLSFLGVAYLSEKVLIVVVSLLLLSALFWYDKQSKKRLRRLSEDITYARLENKSNIVGVGEFLNSQLNMRLPIPAFLPWSLEPDIAAYWVAEVRRQKPDVILELGSGSSSVLIAYALEANKKGKLIAVESSVEYYERTRALLQMHDLMDYVTVIHAPIVALTGDLEGYNWYNPRAIEHAVGGDMIDMLIVDGPPGGLNRWARYPALPMVAEKITNTTTILLDDLDREDEKGIASEWSKKFGINYTMLPLSRPVARFQKLE